MPKGVYSRDGEFKGTWSDEQDAMLKRLCETVMSYGAIAKELSAAFPNDRKSRSAVIARAKRRGYDVGKPHEWGFRRKRKVSPNKRVTVRKNKPRVTLAPVVFKQSDPQGLRSDAEPILNTRGRTSKSVKTPEQIAEAQKGHVPCIIEQAPLTSVPFSSTDGCKWPTSEDVRCMEVCGAPIALGSYCERHGRVAYREMPTAKRNREYGRRGTFETRKRISDDDAQWIADNVLDDVVEGPGISPETDMMVTTIISKE